MQGIIADGEKLHPVSRETNVSRGKVRFLQLKAPFKYMNKIVL